MSRKFNLYLGEAGQAAATSYFLALGWNVATPKVDVGDDLFVIEDKEGYFIRVQVKTTQPIERKNGFSARFKLPLKQLQNRYNPELYYVLMIYRNREWLNKIIISRAALLSKYENHGIGSYADGDLYLTFTFEATKITCSGVDFAIFHNNFDDFPAIDH